MWASFAFKVDFALGALVCSFSGSFAGRFLEASWRRCHSSSGLCLSQFVLFLHVIPDRLMMIRSDLCVEHWLLSDSLCKHKSHWIITINGKMNVWKCKLIFSLCNFLGYNDIIQWGDSCWPLRHIVIGCSQAQQRSQNSEQTYGHAVPYQMLRERFRPCSRTPSQLHWASDPYRSSTDYADWSGEQKGHRNGHRAQSSGLLTVIHSLQKRCLDSQREGGIT